MESTKTNKIIFHRCNGCVWSSGYNPYFEFKNIFGPPNSPWERNLEKTPNINMTFILKSKWKQKMYKLGHIFDKTGIVCKLSGISEVYKSLTETDHHLCLYNAQNYLYWRKLSTLCKSKTCCWLLVLHDTWQPSRQNKCWQCTFFANLWYVEPLHFLILRL